MSILRHKKDRNYTTIDNRLLEDKRLSWRAKGIACYLFSKPDGWSINAKHIASCGVEGRDAVQTAMKELEDTGYLVRRKWQNDRGHWNTELELHETAQPTPDNPHDEYGDEDGPDPDEPTPGKPSVGEPTVGQPTLGKSGTIVKTDSVKTEQVKTEVTRTDTEFAADAAPPSPAADADGVVEGETWGEFLSALCWVCYGHMQIKLLTEKQKGTLTREAKVIRDEGYKRHDLRQWLLNEWRRDWRWVKNKQRPTPADVRSGISTVDEGDEFPYAAAQGAEIVAATPGRVVVKPPAMPTGEGFDAQEVWSLLMMELEMHMPSATYDTWVRGTSVVGYEDGVFTVALPSAFARDWLENRLYHTIKRTLGSLIKRAAVVKFVVDERVVA